MGSYRIKEESDVKSESLLQLNVDGDVISIKNLQSNTLLSAEPVKSTKTRQTSV